MELYNALDRLRLALGDYEPVVATSCMDLSPVMTLPVPYHPPVLQSQTVVVNNGVSDRSEDRQRDDKKKNSTRDNLIAGLGVGMVALASTAAAAKYYNQYRRTQAVMNAYRDVVAVYRAMVPVMPYLNACRVTDLDAYFRAWHSEHNVTQSLMRGGLAALSALGLIAAWRFDLTNLGWLSFAGLTYTACHSLFDYLTASAQNSENAFRQAAHAAQHAVWTALHVHTTPPASFQQDLD